MIVVPGGPVLVEGPVELVTDEGGTLYCDRFVVAICACRRSRRYPLCDTSHRRVRRDQARERRNDVRPDRQHSSR